MMQRVRDTGVALACHRESLQIAYSELHAQNGQHGHPDLTLPSWLLLPSSSPGLHEQR